MKHRFSYNPCLRRNTAVPFYILMVLSITGFSQTSFHDFVKIDEEGQMTLFLSENYRLTHRNCADYILETNAINGPVVIEDTVRIYYKNGAKHIETFYKDGKLHGHFKSFDKKGNVAIRGFYSNGVPTDEWKFFYPNGQLNRHIRFNSDGEEILVAAFQKNGDSLVVEGKGEFKGEVSMDLGLQPKTLEGSIQAGKPDGEWIIKINSTRIATELYDQGVLIRGTLHSYKLGDTPYEDEWPSTSNKQESETQVSMKNPLVGFRGAIDLESLSILNNRSCYSKRDILLDKAFFGRLRQVLNGTGFIEYGDNSWYFVEIKADKKMNILDVKIISDPNHQAASEKLIKLVKDLRILPQLQKDISLPNEYFGIFPMIIKEGVIYLPN